MHKRRLIINSIIGLMLFSIVAGCADNTEKSASDDSDAGSQKSSTSNEESTTSQEDTTPSDDQVKVGTDEEKESASSTGEEISSEETDPEKNNPENTDEESDATEQESTGEESTDATDEDTEETTEESSTDENDTDTDVNSSDTSAATESPSTDTSVPTSEEQLNEAIGDLPVDDAEKYQALKAEYESSIGMTHETFAEKYAVSFTETLDYDPLTAQNLTLIQESTLALSETGLAKLSENGFVIVQDTPAPTFFNAYESIYQADLPVYVSADSILDAIHRSYDAILEDVETLMLNYDLTIMLDNMRANLASWDDDSIDDATLNDLDFYLAVALSLLKDEVQAPVLGADSELVSTFYNLAIDASGMEQRVLFGIDRLLDFSQFTPRGHYDTWELRPYFRAMMWLGRIDFRLVETDRYGNRNLNRDQVEATLAMAALMDAGDLTLWNRINEAIEVFVGKSDNMTVLDVDALKTDLGITNLGDLSTLDDETIKQTILSGGYGTQQICSHLMINGMESGTLPLNSSFLLFGQRYVIDSHVFSNVVYDRVQNGNVYRMMPDPLDVAFTALDNDQAADLLSDDLSQYPYASELHMSREMVNAHGDDFWGENLYTLWLDTLRKLSPTDEVSDPAANGLSTVFGTEEWGRRMLNTQMGSWAELRHDTLLYAKQSYTAIPECEYPDAYVDPYPEFFDAVIRFADKGLTIATFAEEGGQSYLARLVGDYFTQLASAATLLGEMAAQQRDGIPFTEDQLAFINDTVYIGEEDVVCAFVDVPVGWYTRLFYRANDLLPFVKDPTIADVHTQPADEGGNIVGHILHVAVGDPRMMVVTVNTCDGPRAYVGPVFSYHEKITNDFERLTDQDWLAELNSSTPSDVPWMTPIISQ